MSSTKPILYKDDRGLWNLCGPRHRDYPGRAPDSQATYWSPGIHSYGATPREVWIRFLTFEAARSYIAGDYACQEAQTSPVKFGTGLL